MPRILFISNTANFSKFNRAYMKQLQSEGWIVDYASMGEESVPDCDHDYKIHIARSPFSLTNILGVKDVKQLLEKNKYDIIHCHTPMGGVIGRAAAKKLWRQKKIKVLYTAHGFHFYKGAPILNWLLYYPVEKWYSRFTDLLLTIVPEDYQLASNKMHCPVTMVDGVGVDLSRFVPLEAEKKSKIREKNGFSDEDFIITVVAETNKNKNQIMLLKQIHELTKSIPSLKLLLIGKETLPIARNYVDKHNLGTQVFFLGYRSDIHELTGMSNISFSSSIREGLPVNIIEAMACGVPIVASINRGHSSLITDGETGYLFPLERADVMREKILAVATNSEKSGVLGINAVKKSKRYSIEIVLASMMKIYDDYLRR